ncbi:MAG: hypothetical protein FWC97_03370 [Treponema sp.]|nr:hypothetical protein [Treponema sp.]
MNNTANLKDKALIFAWIAGLLLLISLLWIVTQNLQSNYVLRTVNNVLISNNDPRRLSSPLRSGFAETASNLFGFWYSMHNSTDIMFVFGVFQDGIMVPFGAILSDYGRVNEVIPLSAHAAVIFDGLPESVLQMYITRIEGNRQ